MSRFLHLLSQDGITVRSLEAVYVRHGAEPAFVDEVIAALGQLEPELAFRAVWLLRKAARTAAISADQLERVAELVDVSDHWLFRLTMGQFFSEVTCPPAAREEVFPFLLRWCGDRRVIVRAWALTALLRFKQDPRYADEIRQRLRAARRETGKAMQARLRQLGAVRPVNRRSSGRADLSRPTPGRGRMQS